MGVLPFPPWKSPSSLSKSSLSPRVSWLKLMGITKALCPCPHRFLLTRGPDKPLKPDPPPLLGNTSHNQFPEVLFPFPQHPSQLSQHSSHHLSNTPQIARHFLETSSFIDLNNCHYSSSVSCSDVLVWFFFFLFSPKVL